MPKLSNKEHIIQSILLLWYQNNKRNLPWRKFSKKNLPIPYYVLISEFMLQQTTVSTVAKRFNEFVKKWPSLEKLSKINEKKILQFWSGLGYYNRAINLLKTVKIISTKFKNKIPLEYDTLILLPGVGDYTAKAILGIGFNKPVMPVDSNIERVVSRIYGLKKKKNFKKEVLILANNFISNKNSSDIIQSFMDFGSIVCLPRNPNCEECVIASHCVAKQKNIVSLIPIKIKNKNIKRKKYSRAYVIINKKKEILLRRRSSKGMLPSMLEVPNDSWVNKKRFLKRDEIYKKFNNKFYKFGSIKYSFSHFDLEVEIFSKIVVKKQLKNYEWFVLKKINEIELPTIMKKIISIVIN